MSLSFYNIKKWWKMIHGKSIMHVNQNEGLCYSFNSIRGYYNNLTEKVTKDTENYNLIKPLESKDEKGKIVLFPIAIFQYGLGCYDLFLLNKDKDLMLSKFLKQLEWCYDNQSEDGSWNTFFYVYPKAPYSAMAQGEGCSLLVRGYVKTGEKKYLDAAKKAIDFMLLPIDKGGTAEYADDDVILYEFTDKPYVYNGWLFAIFGLMDYVIITNDEKYKRLLNQSIESFRKRMPNMDMGFWSRYRNDKMIASPFYHRLHISMLSVLFKYTKNQDFNIFKERFENYLNNKKCFKKAFRRKMFQKIFSREK